jgi:hypothetical protein
MTSIADAAAMPAASSPAAATAPSVWAPLLPAALVGCDKFSGFGSGTWPPAGPWPAPTAEASRQAAAASASRATGLLRAAAVVAVTARVAAQGRATSSSALPAAAPASEARPTLAASSSQALLGWALREGPPRLQHELFTTLARRGWVLPHAWLPAALELGRRTAAMRGPLLAVLGSRGNWLAAQRDDWQWAAISATGSATGLASGLASGSSNAGDDRRWSEGSLEQRKAWLLEHRGGNDDQARHAREQLTVALPELPARERAELLALLQTQLSPEDEPLLESQRADRSREVREVVLRLSLRLAQLLHEAALAQRAAARIAALLRQDRGLLRTRWVIDAPAAASDEWKADGIEPQRAKNESLGERAWWLYQLARQVPLVWWEQRLAMSPRELLAWAGEGDWAEALCRAWRDVLFAAPSDTWCEAFIAAWPHKALPRDERDAVLGLLPLATREDHWRRALENAAAGKGLTDALLAQLREACALGQGLSAGLSAALAEALPSRLAAQPLAQDWRLREALPELAGLLHPRSLAVFQHLPRQSNETGDETPAVAELLHGLARIAEARLALDVLPQAPKTPEQA